MKKVFEGKLLNLYLKRQKFPNGYVADLEVIKHPGAVLIVPFLAKDKIVMIRQYRPVIDSYIWELPAGTLNKGENTLSCAKRELIEEIGYSAKNWKKIGHIYPAPGYTTEDILIFQAKALKKVKRKCEVDEVIHPKVFLKKDIVKLFKSGRIVDAKTICALSMAKIL